MLDESLAIHIAEQVRAEHAPLRTRGAQPARRGARKRHPRAQGEAVSAGAGGPRAACTTANRLLVILPAGPMSVRASDLCRQQRVGHLRASRRDSPAADAGHDLSRRTEAALGLPGSVRVNRSAISGQRALRRLALSCRRCTCCCWRTAPAPAQRLTRLPFPECGVARPLPRHGPCLTSTTRPRAAPTQPQQRTRHLLPRTAHFSAAALPASPSGTMVLAALAEALAYVCAGIAGDAQWRRMRSE